MWFLITCEINIHFVTWDLVFICIKYSLCRLRSRSHVIKYVVKHTWNSLRPTIKFNFSSCGGRCFFFLSLPAFHGHAGNISVNYSVYGYVESNGRHWEADFVRRSGHTCLLNTCSQLLILNFSVLVASLTGLRCIPLDFMLFISRMKIRTKFLNRLIH